jgi:hypothetical protein
MHAEKGILPKKLGKPASFVSWVPPPMTRTFNATVFVHPFPRA